MCEIKVSQGTHLLLTLYCKRDVTIITGPFLRQRQSEIYDMTGRMVCNNSEVNGTNFSIDLMEEQRKHAL